MVSLSRYSLLTGHSSRTPLSKKKPTRPPKLPLTPKPNPFVSLLLSMMKATTLLAISWRDDASLNSQMLLLMDDFQVGTVIELPSKPHCISPISVDHSYFWPLVDEYWWARRLLWVFGAQHIFRIPMYLGPGSRLSSTDRARLARRSARIRPFCGLLKTPTAKASNAKTQHLPPDVL